MGEMAYEVPVQEHYPPFVPDSDEGRARWDLAVAIAEAISAQNESSGQPNALMTFHLARSVYFSDMPTGSAEDPAPPAAVEEAEAGEDEDPWVARFLELDRQMPPADAPDADAWAHVGKVADLLDDMFGNPDDIELGEYDGQVVEPGDGLSHVEEAFAGVLRKPYDTNLHPRDRMGKWAAKLNGLRSFAKAKHDRVREHVVGAAAAAVLHHQTARAHRPGGALHGEVGKAHGRDLSPAERLRHHAAEERARSGVSGLRQQAIRVGHRTRGEALRNIAWLYTEEGEKKLGPVSENLKDALALQDTVERTGSLREAAHLNKELAHEVARYAVDHRDTVNAVMGAAKHLAVAAARSKGLAAADDELPADGEQLDEATRELVVAALEDFVETE